MTLSAIIATMNRPGDLEKALASVFRQTRRPEQVLVIDQSEDARSREVCARYPGVTYVHQQEKSLVRARNNGLARAGADIISFLDDDIVLEPDYFEKIMAYFEAHPEVGAVSGNADSPVKFAGFKWGIRRLLQRLFLVSFFDGRMTPSGFGYPIFEHLISKPMRVEFLPGCNMNFRASAIAGMRFDERFTGYSYREDADFSYEVSRRHPVMMIPDARLVHNYSPANRLAPLEHKMMEIRNCRMVYRKYRKPSPVNDALFGYSLAGLAFIDLLEAVLSFKADKWRKFSTGVRASWRVLREK